MSAAKTRRARIRVGDWVSYAERGGLEPKAMQVIEDRGRLGVRGRRILRVTIENYECEPTETEIPEEELVPMPRPDSAALMHYFARGGLLDLLRLHIVKTDPAPRVWLTYTRNGELTHTTQRFRGILGGVRVPYFALFEDKVYAGKTAEVLDFLTQFGLSAVEAAEVIKAVGTSAVARRDVVAEAAREQGDVVHYLAGMLAARK